MFLLLDLRFVFIFVFVMSSSSLFTFFVKEISKAVGMWLVSNSIASLHCVDIILCWNKLPFETLISVFCYYYLYMLAIYGFSLRIVIYSMQESSKAVSGASHDIEDLRKENEDLKKCKFKTPGKYICLNIISNISRDTVI